MKGKGKDNNMNLVEQVYSFQLSARVFAAATNAEPYANAFNCQKLKEGALERSAMVSLCPSFGALESSPKVGFSSAVKIQKKGIFLTNFFEGNCSVFSKIVVEPYGKMFSWSLVYFADLLKWQAVATDSSAVMKSGTQQVCRR